MKQVEITLPTLGLLYPKDSVLYKKSKVAIREMSAVDEDILSSPNLIKEDRLIDELIKSCTLDSDIKNNLNKLFTGDKNAIIFAIRITGLGPDYTIKNYTCPRCKEVMDTYTFNLANIGSVGVCSDENMTPDQMDAIKNEFDFVVPSGDKITFSLLNVAEENELMDINKRKKLIQKSGKDELITLRFKKMIKSVLLTDANGLPKTINDGSDISRYVEQMPIRDSKALRMHISKLTPNITLNDVFKCKLCDYQEMVDIPPLDASFFWPEL